MRAGRRGVRALLAALALSGTAGAQSQWVAPPERVRFGEPFGLVLRSPWAEPGVGEDLSPSDLERLEFGPWTLELASETALEDGSVEGRYRVRIFQVGTSALAAPGFPALSIAVDGLLAPEDEGAAVVPFGLWGPPPGAPLWPWLGALVAALAALVLGWLARGKKRAAEGAWGVGDPSAVARARLRELGAAEDDPGRLREVETAVEILREYAQARFGISASSATSAELRAALSEVQGPGSGAQLRAAAADALAGADLAKFAGRRADRELRDRVLRAVGRAVAQDEEPDPRGGEEQRP